MITRDELASMAGVSPTTVSRVFSNPESVKPQKRDAVLAAAKKTGYRLNTAAASLRGNGCRTILLLERRRISSPMTRFNAINYAEALSCVKEVLEASFHHLTLATVTQDEEITPVLQANPCGGILCYQMDSRKVMEQIVASDTPYVTCHQTGHLDAYNRCYTDDYSGAALVGQKLRELGHRLPLHITGDLALARTCRVRWEGFQSGFAGIECRLIDAELGAKGGYASAMQAIPLIRAGQVDCIFVHNDLTSIGVIDALRQEGIRIPEDVSVVGYDNSPFAELCRMRLSTVDHRLGHAYTIAAKLLLESMRTGTKICQAVTPLWVDGETVGSRL